MKALLLQLRYNLLFRGMTWVGCILALFLASSVFGSTILMLYPCVLTYTLTLSLLAYDEQDRWNRCCATLPYTRTEYVSVYYLFHLIATAVVMLLAALTILAHFAVAGMDTWAEDLNFLLIGVSICLLPAALVLPIIFLLGTERGRIFSACAAAVIVMICTACLIALTADDAPTLSQTLPSFLAPPVFLVVPILLYLLSWRLSCRLYEKREL
jgi:hypothetical protein